MAHELQQFGKYRLLRRIASGGMGEVHLAKLLGPSGFEKLVVIKRLLEHRLEEKKYVDMFFSEARVAAQLNHSNVVQVYEVGTLEETPYIAMEYVHGKSLRKVMDMAAKRSKQGDAGGIPPGYLVQIFSALCAGLAFAHNAHHHSGAPMELIHRDVNPLNVLISYQGEIKIIDFGIAKSELTLEKTQTGTIKGTVVYMSPEQSLGHKLDKRSDLFSVGICLYEALTGTNPFHKTNMASSLEAIRAAQVPNIEQSHPQFTPFAAALRKSLARRREERFSDCHELADALLSLIERGAVVRPSVPLGTYMSELFERDIQEERDALERTDMFELENVQPQPVELPAQGSATKPSLRAQSQQRDQGRLFGTRTDAVDLPPEDIAALAEEERIRTGERPQDGLEPDAASQPERTEVSFGYIQPDADDDQQHTPAQAHGPQTKHDTFVGPYTDVDLKVGAALAERARHGLGLGPMVGSKSHASLAPEPTQTPNPLMIIMRPLGPPSRRFALAVGEQLAKGLDLVKKVPLLGGAFRHVENSWQRGSLARNWPFIGLACAALLIFTVAYQARLHQAEAQDTQTQPFAPGSEEALAQPQQLPEGEQPAPAAKEPETPAPPEQPAEHHRTQPLKKRAGAKAQAPKPANQWRQTGADVLSYEVEPAVSVTLDGALMSRPTRLYNRSSVLQFGSTSAADPFVITVRMTESNRLVTYDLDAQPWAEVLGPGGISLGRTPLSWADAGTTAAFEFKNPHVAGSQRITLHRDDGRHPQDATPP